MITINGLTVTVETMMVDDVDSADPGAIDTDDVTLLDDVTLTITAGETVVITGGSGSGKTSLISTINGLIPHIRPAVIDGDVSVNGIIPSDVDITDVGCTTATVFQNPRTQFFATDVMSEIAFGAANQGIPRDEILRRIDDATSLLGLADLRHRRMAELSGGERQRVAIASALVANPSVILLDEPTANLDDASTQAVAEAIARLKAAGATIVIAEHKLYYLKGLADRIVELRHGTVVADRSAEQFWAMSDKQRRDAGLRSLHAPEHSPRPPCQDVGTRGGLHLRGVSATRDGRPLWTIDAASAPRGAVTCVTGPNGVGKTTLVQALSGLFRCHGDVVLDGTTMSTRQRRRQCAVVMQDVNRQLFGTTVWEELYVGRSHPCDAEAHGVLAELGLDGMEGRHPLSLSGGQRQRLAVATAVVDDGDGHMADIIIFDEPTSGLDFHSMEAMAGVIRRCADRGAVVLVVTHDRELVDTVGDFEIPLSPACD